MHAVIYMDRAIPPQEKLPLARGWHIYFNLLYIFCDGKGYAKH